MNSKKILLLFFIILIIFPPHSFAYEKDILIGVLSHRGDKATFKHWSATAEYLSNTLNKTFRIVPLDFNQVDEAIKKEKVDFLIVNSGIYVNMEVKYRISRLVTMNNLVNHHSLNVFGGVVFTRKDRKKINNLSDIKGKSFIAVDETSLGGFQMVWRKLNEHKINPYKDFSKIAFAGIHDNVVMAVLLGEYDVGTVRTNILEKMAEDGLIDLSDFKILSPVKHDTFPFLLSTRLYPEWPFSKLPHTSNQLAQQVAVALLNKSIPHPSNDKRFYSGWTVPLDYQEVHKLFQELKLAPYNKRTPFTLRDIIRKYWTWLLATLIFILSMAIMSSWVFKLNRQLKRSKVDLERQHDLVLNSVCDGIYGVDTEGHCTFMNKSMVNMTGWQPEDLIGKKQHEYLHHTHPDGTPHPSDECPVYHTYHDNITRFIEDDVFWKKNGSSFPVEYSSSSVRDSSGKTVGSVVVFRDISERKQAEEAARKYRADLTHMARINTLGEMASGIAHELNQPLTAIATNAFASIQMLESGSANTEKLIDILEKINHQAEHSGEIIRHLRQFIRKEQPERSLIDLNELIEDVLLMIKPDINRSDVKVVRKFDLHLKKVLAQPIQIDQVILNLCRNALDAMNDTPTEDRILTIATQSSGDNAVIVSIEDTGSGVKQDIREGLFDPFVTSKANGMGLGLSISMGIIDAHQGKLYLDSKPSMGAIFRFALPINQENNNK